jgi:probable rRNA maturation factor
MSVISAPLLTVELQVHIPSEPDFAFIAAIPWDDWLGKWLTQLLDLCPPAPAYELTLRLTRDLDIQALNRQFRHQDRPTDVLAFAALEVDLPMGSLPPAALAEPLYLGDVVISVEQAQRQAQERGHSLTYELAWLTAHGFLHLLGWDHPDEASLATMLAQQNTLLTQIGWESA